MKFRRQRRQKVEMREAAARGLDPYGIAARIELDRHQVPYDLEEQERRPDAHDAPSGPRPRLAGEP